MGPKTKPSKQEEIPLVAIGASAGGLEPIEKFFDAVTGEPGMSFVIVQHLSPDYRSMMDELLSRRTNLPIKRITDGLALEENTIYLNRADTYVELINEVFRTSPYVEGEDLPHLPIDRLFTSLSSRDPKRTIAVVMSGSGSDGAQGAQVLHGMGAAVLVQSMKESSFNSMPRSVLLSGAVDRVLDAADMPSVLQDIFTFGKQNSRADQQPFSDGVGKILALLEAQNGLDFRNYKASNVNRRLIRRMSLRGHANLAEYEGILAQDPEALDELFHDMLIGVTEFYRDPEAVASLRVKVLNKLAQDTEANAPIKIWVPACATGEEVYTIAMELSEALREAGSSRRFRIIGSDIHAGSIETASRGYYSDEKMEGVPSALRERYFTKTSEGYVVNASLRQQIIFSTLNLISDPPFINLDLVSCRNLLIYFDDESQGNTISMFIFGLLNGGHLFLGASESVGKFGMAFEIVDAKWRIFKKTGAGVDVSRNVLKKRAVSVDAPRLGAMTNLPVPPKKFQTQISELQSREVLMRSYDTMLKRYAPSSILMTTDGKVLNWFGAASQVVDTMNNLADWTVQEIVHSDLHFAINVGVEKIRLGQEDAHSRTVTVNLPDRSPCECHVSVESLDQIGGNGLVLAKVDFSGEAQATAGSVEILPADDVRNLSEDSTILAHRVHTLERDLRFTEETLQHVTERLEASGEELQASNEELQASNEELQASNEELQSSNEELHAVNEELVSVSAEHRRKIDLLSELNEDTEVILKILKTGVLLLDQEYRLRRFSALVESAFLLQDHDINRAISTVGPRLDFADLVVLTEKLKKTREPQIVSGDHKGVELTVEVRETTFGAIDSRMPGFIVLFRW